ncbi:MAG: TrbI/VirB10 family protein [Vicinamibacterales bacterium]
MADPTLDPVPPRVTDRRIMPAGVVPRRLQQWGVIGIATVMVAILALSGPPKKSYVPPGVNPDATAVDANAQRIDDYRRTIQEQATRLAAEQAQLQLTKASLGLPGAAPLDATASRPSPDAVPVSAGVAGGTERRVEPAHVADNVAYSRVSTAAPVATVPTAPSPAWPPVPPGALWPTPAPPVSPAPVSASAPTSDATPTPPALRGAAQSAPAGDDRRYRLSEGTVIDAVLTNRLDGTFPGPVNALVSTPVYAADRVVIPAGARVLGEARAVNTFGQTRLAVVFHRLLLPSGSRIELDALPALNQVGDLGLHDQVDAHYGQIFGVSVALGLLSGFSQGRTTAGLDATAPDAYRQGVASSLGTSSTHVLDRFLNRLPTVTIREGHRLKVYLTRDLDLPVAATARVGYGGVR